MAINALPIRLQCPSDNHPFKLNQLINYWVLGALSIEVKRQLTWRTAVFNWLI